MYALLDYGSPVITLVLLTAVGLDLRTADFARVREQPRLVAAGVLAPPLLLPVLAMALIAVFAPQPVEAAGLLLLVCCPAGGVSNTYSYLARASTALSVTLTAVSCAAAVVTIPATTLMLEYVWHQRLAYDVATGPLAVKLLVLLALPIGAGMAARARWPELADRCRMVLQRAAFVLLGLLLLVTMASADEWTRLHLGPALLLAIAFTVSAFVLGGAVAMAVGGTRSDRFTVAAEFATRNVAVAVALALSIAGIELALFALLYLTCEIPLLVLASLAFRRLSNRQPTPELESV